MACRPSSAISTPILTNLIEPAPVRRRWGCLDVPLRRLRHLCRFLLRYTREKNKSIYNRMTKRQLAQLHLFQRTPWGKIDAIDAIDA